MSVLQGWRLWPWLKSVALFVSLFLPGRVPPALLALCLLHMTFLLHVFDRALSFSMLILFEDFWCSPFFFIFMSLWPVIRRGQMIPLKQKFCLGNYKAVSECLRSIGWWTALSSSPKGRQISLHILHIFLSA